MDFSRGKESHAQDSENKMRPTEHQQTSTGHSRTRDRISKIKEEPQVCAPGAMKICKLPLDSEAILGRQQGGRDVLRVKKQPEQGVYILK